MKNEPQDPPACDVLIAGGGAAGLASGVFAAEEAARQGHRLEIAILDGAEAPGKKILISGGGRCNVLNAHADPSCFNGDERFVGHVLAAFPVPRAREWLESLGVALKEEETGKLFPVTDRARTVLDALTRRCDTLGITRHVAEKITAVARAPGGFTVAAKHQWLARAVVLATGGQTVPSTGSDGSGYRLAVALGHTVTALHPALVALTVAETFGHGELAGVSLEAELRLETTGTKPRSFPGGLLFTHFGISGPAALDLSRHWLCAQGRNEHPRVYANLIGAANPDAAAAWLGDLCEAEPRRDAANLLAGRIPRRLAEFVARKAGVEGSLQAGRLSRTLRRALALQASRMEIPVTGCRGWNHGEVTAGGVPLTEVDSRTLASKRCPNLYFAGEILDCDGHLGGFNFHWAWATGRVAGIYATRAALANRPGGP